MSAKKIIRDAQQRREAKARARAAKRQARLQRALTETTTTGLRKVVRLPEVEAMTGRGRTAILADGNFPQSIPLGGRARGWLITEIEDWVAARAAERHQHNKA